MSSLIKVSSFFDLKKFGIEPLTGEACPFGQRILCDLNEEGKNLLEQYFGTEITSKNWNSFVGEDKAIASIMLSKNSLKDIVIFILFMKKYKKVYIYDKVIYGVNEEDLKHFELFFNANKDSSLYKESFTNPIDSNPYSRNIHTFSGRVV